MPTKPLLQSDDAPDCVMTENDGAGHDGMTLFGVGPVFVVSCLALTAVAITLSTLFVPQAVIGTPWLRAACAGAGTALIIAGVVLWCAAVFGAKLPEAYAQSGLVTSGVFAVVRNPIYAAFMLAFTGLTLIFGNVCCFPLFFVYWALMTMLLKRTEEPWLAARFGDAYADYCARTNRCLPWFPRAPRRE